MDSISEDNIVMDSISNDELKVVSKISSLVFIKKIDSPVRQNALLKTNKDLFLGQVVDTGKLVIFSTASAVDFSDFFPGLYGVYPYQVFLNVEEIK